MDLSHPLELQVAKALSALQGRSDVKKTHHVTVYMVFITLYGIYHFVG